jgi:hypothetical protein
MNLKSLNLGDKRDPEPKRARAKENVRALRPQGRGKPAVHSVR